MLAVMAFWLRLCLWFCTSGGETEERDFHTSGGVKMCRWMEEHGETEKGGENGGVFLAAPKPRVMREHRVVWAACFVFDSR